MVSATEVIEQIKQLPREEQRKVTAFVREMTDAREESKAQVRYANDANFDKAADKVLREHADLFRRLAQ